MEAEKIMGTLDAPPSAACSSLYFDVLNEHIEFAVHRAILVLMREFVQQSGGVRPVTFNALVLIGANPGITQSELAGALMLDKGTAAHLLSDLERQGWIERRHRLRDRRWKGVYLSPSGVQETERLKAEVRKHANRFHSLFTPEEYRQLLELLNRIVKAGGVRV
jgi:DNA-binding MarR family transcriptional regulator